VANPTGTTEKALPSGSQIKSRDRVRDLAEVYTHEREINAMLALVRDMFPTDDDPGNTDRTFLEPACGSGNFVVEILSRKLRYVTRSRYGRGERFEHRVLRCLASIYGIDISDDNVGEARGRMWAVIAAHLERHLGTGEPTAGFSDAVGAILETNVIRADTLADAAEIELVEYRPGSVGTFIREWSRPLDPAADEPNLFSRNVRRDEVPVHYSQLARQTEPVLADPLGQEAA
jgi:hypothetical protein